MDILTCKVKEPIKKVKKDSKFKTVNENKRLLPSMANLDEDSQALAIESEIILLQDKPQIQKHVIQPGLLTK